MEIPQGDKKEARKTAPIEGKESLRWPDGLRQALAFAQRCPDTQCVYVADSEADIYEPYAGGRGSAHPTHRVIRLCHGRAPAEHDAAGAPARRIPEQVQATAALPAKDITVRGRKAKVSCETRRRRQPRQDREAAVEVRAATVALAPRGDRIGSCRGCASTW